ncbi:acetyltransferase [Geofilum rhodophaeum]|jgi:sugar O-acyltransferase (sialic acid O-acetyltransferase NeuD family)|uniref:acetyltransferase n=1 Tax=Geofilum rhodophaeum TaxID=1965019 RepID=UPI000B5280DB|nr:acetyltransferase [Geofilum rhodophaeum]
MKNLIIIGAGGHGAELDDYLHFSQSPEEGGLWKLLGYLDDSSANYERYRFSAPWLGSIAAHRVRSDCHYLIGIANLKYRRRFVELFLEQGARFATFIHPSAWVSPSASIGPGNVVGPYANLGPNVRIGAFNFLNARCSLGHDTCLGDFNFIGPNVSLSGFTRVGSDNLFGINSATLPHSEIGDRNQIAAGMVLDRKVKDDTVVFFRYKERLVAVGQPLANQD